MARSNNYNFVTIGRDCPICGGRHGGCSRGSEPGSLEFIVNCYDQETLNGTKRNDGVIDSFGEKYIRVGKGNGGSCSIWVPENQFYMKDRDRYNITFREVLPYDPTKEPGFGRSNSKKGSRGNTARKARISEIKSVPSIKPLEAATVSKWFYEISLIAGLNETSKRYLQERGLCLLEILQGKYFSVNKETIAKLSRVLSEKLPTGFPAWSNKQKQFYINTEPGIGIPIFDKDRNIIGVQIRHFNGDTRYTWWSNNKVGASAKIQVNDSGDAELPITYVKPIDRRKRQVERVTDNMCLLTEGVLKPHLAAVKHQTKAIGAAGFNLIYSPRLFLKTLEAAKNDCPDPDNMTFVVAPDAGSTINESVLQKIKKLCDFLRKHKYKHVVLWYGQIFKPQTYNQSLRSGDVDEISRTLNRMHKFLLVPNDFFRLAAKHLYMKGLAQYFEAEKDSLGYATESKEWQVRRVNNRYLSRDFDFKETPEGLIAIKSPMNTGKTFGLASLIYDNEDVEDGDDPTRSVILGSRNALLLQTSDRVGAVHKSELMKQKDYNAFRECPTISLCVDSLLRLNINDFYGACLIIDEVESVMNHLLLGSTCAKNRTKIFFKLQTICRNIALSGGKIILMDANLSARTIRFFEETVTYGNVEFPKYYVHNEYECEELKWDVRIFLATNKVNNEGVATSVLKNDRSVLYSEIFECLRTGGRPFICTDSKDEALAITQYINEWLEPTGQKGMAITSETLDDNAKAFLKDPKSWLEKNQDAIRFIASSPTVESGLSVEGDFFSQVFGVFYGATSTTDTQMQMLGRVRANVPRTIFCQETASGAKTLLTDESISRRLYDKDLMKSDVIGALTLSGEINGFSDYVEKIWNELERNTALQRLSPSLWYTPFLELVSQLMVAQNWNKSNLRKELISTMQKKGHRVELLDTDIAALEYSGEVKEAKEFVRRNRASEISAAPVITIGQARRLSDSDDANNPQVLRQIQRAFLQDELPGIELSDDMVYKCAIENNGEWLSNIKKISRINDVNSHITREAATYFYEFIDRENPMARLTDLPTSSITYTALIELGIRDLINPESSWDREQLIELFAKAKKNRSLVKRLNLSTKRGSLNLKDSLEWANTLLAFVGMTLILGEDGISYKLDTSENYGNEEWCQVLGVVQQRLLDRANEAASSVGSSIFKQNQIEEARRRLQNNHYNTTTVQATTFV